MASEGDVYEPHLNREEVDTKLAEGQLFSGTLRVNPQNRSMGFVTVTGLNIDIFIDGEINRNRSLNGDKVVVELFPREQWVPTSSTTPAEVSPPSDTIEPALPTPQHAITKKCVPTVCEAIDCGIEESTGVVENPEEGKYIGKSLEPNEEKLASKSHTGLSDTQSNSLWHPRLDLLNTSSSERQSTESEALRAINLLSLQPKGKIVYIFEKDRTKTHVGALHVQCRLQPGQNLPNSQKYIFFNVSWCIIVSAIFKYPNIFNISSLFFTFSFSSFSPSFFNTFN